MNFSMNYYSLSSMYLKYVFVKKQNTSFDNYFIIYVIKIRIY